MTCNWVENYMEEVAWKLDPDEWVGLNMKGCANYTLDDFDTQQSQASNMKCLYELIKRKLPQSKYSSPKVFQYKTFS